MTSGKRIEDAETLDIGVTALAIVMLSRSERSLPHAVHSVLLNVSLSSSSTTLEIQACGKMRSKVQASSSVGL